MGRVEIRFESSSASSSAAEFAVYDARPAEGAGGRRGGRRQVQLPAHKACGARRALSAGALEVRAPPQLRARH